MLERSCVTALVLCLVAACSNRSEPTPAPRSGGVQDAAAPVADAASVTSDAAPPVDTASSVVVPIDAAVVAADAATGDALRRSTGVAEGDVCSTHYNLSAVGFDPDDPGATPVRPRDTHHRCRVGLVCCVAPHGNKPAIEYGHCQKPCQGPAGRTRGCRDGCPYNSRLP